MLETIINQKIFIYLGVLSLFTFLLSLLVIPYFLIRIPSNYFIRVQERNFKKREISLKTILKNSLAFIVFLIGVLMIFTPGQGILTMIIAIFISDFSFKRRFELYLISLPKILSSINMIRRKAGKNPLLAHDSEINTFDDAQNYIESFIVKSPIHGQKNLERMRKLLKKLKNPEKDLKIIHVAGTSGKGSTTEIIGYMLRKNNFKNIATYISPHINLACERIKINGVEISKNSFLKHTKTLKSAIETYKKNDDFLPSYWDILLAIAFLYFKEKSCDYVVLETGIGGKNSNTNIVNPVISAITNVGLDHCHILGNTKEEIAKIKGGIIKRKTAFFTSEQDNKILDIFRNIAKEKDSGFYEIKAKDLILTSRFPELKFNYKKYSFKSKLLGDYQVYNIALAADIINFLGYKVPRNIDLNLPARIEIKSIKPLIIWDVSHNEDKIKNLVSIFKDINKEIKIFFAAKNTKDYEKEIAILKEYSKTFYLTEFKNRYFVSEKLENLVKKFSPNSFEICADKNANRLYNLAKRDLKDNQALVVCGSFFLIEELNKRHHEKPSL